MLLIFRFFLIALFATVLVPVFLLPQAHADQKQSKLKAEISIASTKLGEAKAFSESIRGELERNESEINRLSRKQYQTERKIDAITRKLMESGERKITLARKVKEEKEALARQLLAMYTSGEQSHLRLLLKQDDPSDISRTTKYFEYLNRSRLKRINKVRDSLTTARELERKISIDREDLRKLRAEQIEDKQRLEIEIAKNSEALKQAKSVVVDKKRVLTKLKREEARLQAVFEELERRRRQRAAAERKRREAAKKAAAREAAKVARETAKREAARAAQRRAELKRSEDAARRNGQQVAQARARAEAAQARAEAAETRRIREAAAAKRAADKKKKVKLGKATKPRFRATGRPFSKQRGRLPWPVKGNMYKKYGSRRNAKQKWKGVLIKAPGGRKVHAVARGLVEYAGPLRGYGFVVIILHDKNYRTLYAYNRAVYRKIGDRVNAGDVISAVGNSGGQSQNALYFEIRKGAIPQNPSRWCK